MAVTTEKSQPVLSKDLVQVAASGILRSSQSSGSWRNVHNCTEGMCYIKSPRKKMDLWTWHKQQPAPKDQKSPGTLSEHLVYSASHDTWGPYKVVVWHLARHFALAQCIAYKEKIYRFDENKFSFGLSLEFEKMLRILSLGIFYKKHCILGRIFLKIYWSIYLESLNLISEFCSFFTSQTHLELFKFLEFLHGPSSSYSMLY